MGQHYTEELETELASDIIRLFNRYNLTAPQAKSLLKKVRVRRESGGTSKQPSSANPGIGAGE